MRVARHELLGRLLEVREGDLGEHFVLMDGRVVSVKRFGWWVGGSSHFFDLDSEGRVHHVEVQVRGWRMTRTPAVVLVDGVERASLSLVGRRRAQQACPSCGYSLAGLLIENEEVMCPECGRHASITLLGLKRGSRVVPGQQRATGA